jgi:hypothetical protein
MYKKCCFVGCRAIDLSVIGEDVAGNTNVGSESKGADRTAPSTKQKAIESSV